MEDLEEPTWKDKKINKYFRQVKPRPKVTWPPPPPHLVVAPPPAIAVDPFSETPTTHAPSLHGINSTSGRVRDGSTAQSSQTPHRVIADRPPTSGTLSGREGIGSSSSMRCSAGVVSEGRSSCSMAVDVTSTTTSPLCRRLGSLQQQQEQGSGNNTRRSSGILLVPSNGGPTTSTTTSRPRKRFRKKVSGLFGENTDLNKRMSKLIRNTDLSKIVIGRDAADADLQMRKRQPACALMDTGSLLSCLPGQSTSDSFDFVELTEAATKALGSPERLTSIRKAMGTLDPMANERFLDELNLGVGWNQNNSSQPQQPSSSMMSSLENHKNDLVSGTITTTTSGSSSHGGGPVNTIQPPKLPLPTLHLSPQSDKTHTNSSMDTSQCDSPASPSLTPTRRKLFLPGVPAILRSKTRRADRGYRSKDVVEARLKAAKVVGSLSSTSASSSFPLRIMHPPLRKINSTSTKRFISSGEFRRLCGENGKRRASATTTTTTTFSDRGDGESFQNEECIVPHGGDVKRRRRRPPSPHSNDEELEGSPVTHATSASEVDREREIDHEDEVRRMRMSTNPLTMLVEAATGHRLRHDNDRVNDDDDDENEDESDDVNDTHDDNDAGNIRDRRVDENENEIQVERRRDLTTGRIRLS